MNYVLVLYEGHSLSPSLFLLPLPHQCMLGLATPPKTFLAARIRHARATGQNLTIHRLALLPRFVSCITLSVILYFATQAEWKNMEKV